MTRLGEVVDVIVPVYNAVADLRRCVASVRACTATPYRLLLIDDASTDPAVAAYFIELESDLPDNWLLLRNDRNLGFVGTTNLGMALSEHDVVLLNSDTVVTSRWLDKLKRCAASSPRIGTITPFSNNAEICSFPRFCENNAWSERDDPERLNHALERAAVPTYPDLPTGVGFCFYIKRSLLREIGAFDPVFGLGYGEENDFCMRARNAGYRNVLCEDTLVLHLGNRSFDAKKKALSEKNTRLLLDRHPDYQTQVMDFIRADPLRPLREAAQSQYAIVAAGAHRPGILHIQHGKGGGTENHIRTLIGAAGTQYRQYLLTTVGEAWEFEDHSDGEIHHYYFRHQQDEIWSEFLNGLCAAFAIDIVHVHHLSGCREGLLAALGGLNVPYGFTIHDFYLACPTVTLLDARDTYCEAQTDLARCQACLNEQTGLRGISIAAWREQHMKFFAGASFVLSPSASAAATLARYFPMRDVTVVPHALPHSTWRQPTGLRTVLLLPRDGKPAVGVLGAIGPVKGARILERMVERTRQRKLGFRWVLVGYLDRQYQAYQDNDAVLTIHGPYRQEDVSTLLDHYGVNLLVFPSAGPETFSFTLSEAWAAGRPALVPPIGALGERMQQYRAGWCMDDWTNVDAVLDQIERLLSPAAEPAMREARARAQRVAVEQGANMIGETSRVYREHLLASPPASAAPLSPERILKALRSAHTVAEARHQHHHSFVETAMLRIAHIGLRLRYTIFGRVLYRIVPQAVQRDLKRRLLA